jgi:hypothetical protein
MKRLFIVQHGLVDRHSHFYGETKGWIAACEARGVAFRIYVNRLALPELVEELAAKPAFPYAPDVSLDQDPLSGRLSDFLTLAESFAQGCAALEADGIAGDDVLLVPFSTERDLFGAALWLERIAANRQPTAIFVFHNPDFSWAVGEQRRKVDGDFSRWRLAMKRLRQVLPAKKLIVRATNPRLAEVLGNVFDYPCEKCPHPTYYMDAVGDTEALEKSDPRVTVRLAGQFRREKGAGLVIPVLLNAARSRPGLSFALQVENQQQARDLAEQLAPLSQNGAVCHIKSGHASHEVYLWRVAHSEILLLPYHPKRYALRNSGVFAEAVGFAVVTVVPDRTWMADMLREGWGAGTIFQEPTVEAVTAALIDAIDRRAVLLAGAKGTAAAWRKIHAVDVLLDQLLTAAG